MTPKSRLVVQKYGGATLAGTNRIKEVASFIANRVQGGDQILAVVSAMGASTNQLIGLAQEISSHPPRRELDMLLSVGERVSAALLAMALKECGVPAVSFTGSQAGILTDESHFQARIQRISAPRVQEALAQNQVVVLAGYQGVSPQTKDITTLGRGGTDVTAVAMSIALGARQCEILKEVSGVFSGDPQIIPNPHLIPHLTHQRLLQMCFAGAKMLHSRAAALAREQNLPLFIGSLTGTTGTWILSESQKSQIENTNAAKEKKLEIPRIESVQKINQVFVLSSRQWTWRSLKTYFAERDWPVPQLLQVLPDDLIVRGFFEARLPEEFQKQERCWITVLGHHLDEPRVQQNFLEEAGQSPWILSESDRFAFLCDPSAADEILRRLHHRFIDSRNS